jgi:hypothetical protein
VTFRIRDDNSKPFKFVQKADDATRLVKVKAEVSSQACYVVGLICRQYIFPSLGQSREANEIGVVLQYGAG